jgi:DNA helicase HerA-like ATPase
VTPRGLRIAADLSLPVDVVTQPIAILARRGAGKTYTAAVLVEEVVRTKVPVVVLDTAMFRSSRRLAAAYPDELSKEELAERTGYSLTSSSFGNALGKLRSLGLVVGFRASPDLVGGGQP